MSGLALLLAALALVCVALGWLALAFLAVVSGLLCLSEGQR